MTGSVWLDAVLVAVAAGVVSILPHLGTRAIRRLVRWRQARREADFALHESDWGAF